MQPSRELDRLVAQKQAYFALHEGSIQPVDPSEAKMSKNACQGQSQEKLDEIMPHTAQKILRKCPSKFVARIKLEVNTVRCTELYTGRSTGSKR